MSNVGDREPCPWRIVDDIGGAFFMGSVGGGTYHFIRGLWTAPPTWKKRAQGVTSAIQARAGILGGQFAVWGGIFACCDCSLTAIRGKEDPWNSIWSGFITGGVLAARAGPKVMAQSAVIGGLLLGMIEGLGLMITNMSNPRPEDYQAIMPPGATDLTAPPTEVGTLRPDPTSLFLANTNNTSNNHNEGEPDWAGMPDSPNESMDIASLLKVPSSSTSSSSNDFNMGLGMPGTGTSFSSGTDTNHNDNDTERKSSGSGWWPLGRRS